jgi:hypothetical protein
MRDYENVFCEYTYLRPRSLDREQQNENKEITFLLNRARWHYYDTEKL